MFLKEIYGNLKIPKCWIDYKEEVLKLDNSECMAGLEAGFISKVCNVYNFSKEFEMVMLETAEYVKEHDVLIKLYQLWYHVIFSIEHIENVEAYHWPSTDFFPKKLEGMFPALVVFARLPWRWKVFSGKAIPKHIVEKIDQEVIKSTDMYFKKNGFYGLGVFMMGWLRCYVDGRLFWLGELQYEIIKCWTDILMFQKKGTDEYKLLMGRDTVIRSDGLIDGTNGLFDKKSYMTKVIEDADGWRGYTINECGTVLPEVLELPKTQWECIFKKGEMAINIHIPEKAKFDNELCKQSMEQAVEFFGEYFPEHGFKCFTCFSWLLDSQLQLFLNESSNIYRFQKFFLLFPKKSNDKGMFFFLFESGMCHYSKLEAKSSLQKKVIRYMEMGGRMRMAGGLIPVEKILK